MNVAPCALSLAHLDRLSGLDRDARKLGDLNTPLVDRALALAIDDGWEDQSGLGACDLQKIVIHNPCACILVDDIAKFCGVVDVVEEFTGGVAKSATRNIGDGQHACAGNLDPMSWIVSVSNSFESVMIILLTWLRCAVGQATGNGLDTTHMLVAGSICMT